MSGNSTSLREIERRAYLSTFKDGIYDILCGSLFLALALIPILEAIGMSRFVGYALYAIPFMILWLGRRYITIPRMGMVEFGLKRKKKERITLIIGVVTLFLALSLFVVVVNQDWWRWSGGKLVAALLVPFLAFALFRHEHDFPRRFYIYITLLLFSALAAKFLFSLVGSPLNDLLGFGLPGIVVTSIGINILIKFIKAHPRSEASYVK